MQDTAIDHQPRLLAPAVRLGLAAAVGLGLAAVLSVATSASHTAVGTMSAQFRDAARFVTLPPVEIVGRREIALEAPKVQARARYRAATTAAAPATKAGGQPS